MAGREQAAGVARANGLDDVGADGGGDETQARLGEAEVRALDGDGQVAGGRKACPAAERAALDQGHGQHRQVVQGLQHLGQFEGVGAVVVFRMVQRHAHPAEVGAGRERPARAAEEDHPHALGAGQGVERLQQRRDQVGVKGVLPLRPVQDHRDRAGLRGLDVHQVRGGADIGRFDEGVGDRVGHGRGLRLLRAAIALGGARRYAP